MRRAPDITGDVIATFNDMFAHARGRTVLVPRAGCAAGRNCGKLGA